MGAAIRGLGNKMQKLLLVFLLTCLSALPVFADAIIRKFEARSGIVVQVRYDEETNKSLGMTNLLISDWLHYV